MAADSNNAGGTAPKPAERPKKAKAQGNATVKPSVKPKVKTKVGDADESESQAKARKGALFLGVVVIGYIVFLVFTGQMSSFIDALSQVEARWIWGAVGAFVMYFVFGVGAYAVAVLIDHDSPVGIRDLMSVEASGIFFGNLTPMMAGSVPAQIVRLTRTGLDVGEASATQFTRFIMFQFGVVLFAAIMLVAEFRFFLETYGNIVFFNLVVFGAHFIELLVLFVICLCPGFVKRVGNGALDFVNKRHALKSYDNWHTTINVQVDEFSTAFKRAGSDLPSMGVTLLVTMAQLACFYMIPWFVIRAFGYDANFMQCLAAGSMVQMVSTVVPLPGGTGGAEGSFYTFFGRMFGESAFAGFLVWRIVTFFGPTILSAPMLGLRSRGGDSLYHRWQRLINGRSLGGGASINPSRRRSSAGGVTVRTSGGGSVKISGNAKDGSRSAASAEKANATADKPAKKKRHAAAVGGVRVNLKKAARRRASLEADASQTQQSQQQSPSQEAEKPSE